MRSAAALAVWAVLHAVCELNKLKALLSSSVDLPALMTGTRLRLYFSRASVLPHQSDDKLLVSFGFGYCVIALNLAACEVHWQTKLVTVGSTPSLLLKRHEYLSKVIRIVLSGIVEQQCATVSRTTRCTLLSLYTCPDQRNRRWIWPF